jgi:inner membrane protein
MATLFVHPLVPVACRMGTGVHRVSNRLLVCSMIASILPDADVIAFYFGIPYENSWGHRGWTHSIAFALLVGGLGVVIAATLHASRWA